MIHLYLSQRWRQWIGSGVPKWLTVSLTWFLNGYQLSACHAVAVNCSLKPFAPWGLKTVRPAFLTRFLDELQHNVHIQRNSTVSSITAANLECFVPGRFEEFPKSFLDVFYRQRLTLWDFESNPTKGANQNGCSLNIALIFHAVSSWMFNISPQVGRLSYDINIVDVH